MAEALGVALCATFFFAEVFDGALGEVAVAGVHGDDAMRDALQQLDRIFTGEIGVRGVVVHAEVWVVHGIDQFAEDIHRQRHAVVLGVDNVADTLRLLGRQCRRHEQEKGGEGTKHGVFHLEGESR